MPISEQTNTIEAMAGHPAQAKSETRQVRVIELDGQGKILSDTTTVEPTVGQIVESNDPCVLKVTCHGASMEIPTDDPVATACEIINYLEKMA